MIEKYCIISFHSTHEAISAEKILKGHSLTIQIIPIPKEITAGCGLSIKLDSEDMEKALAILKEEKLEHSGCYDVEKQGLSKTIIPYHHE